ncbi:hypothetical protein HU200_057793 [Digitaria exilis]|uniref:Filament-like plant protein 7 n=1 Tax=Digitaria exilis TaxID=1010633 RepID=A0A835AJ01_9POAL|nr:hypothetical protein HU200_057793 [Digitaria exilis]
MDHKAWPWKKKSAEREVEKEKIALLEKSLQDLNEQLSCAHAECIEKDGILVKQNKVAEEAILGWEKAEAEALVLKAQLDDTLDEKTAMEQRICQLDEALNVAMVERDTLIKETTQMLSYEQGKVQKLEENLMEKINIITSLDAENDKLSEILSVKENLISELIESKQVIESNFKDLTIKLESSERSNSSLRYEVCMLQKQLEIRSEERKFSLKSADVAHKQHLENVKKITKLESECQRLRSMVRKRLPGPAAIAKMRNEVETLGSDAATTRVRKLNPARSQNPYVSVQNSHDASHGNSPLLARLHAIEDENKAIKESLSRKDGELQFSRTMLARTTSKLSQVEDQLEELSRGRTAAELVKVSPMVVENPLSSISEDCCNKDNVSCSGSWASALLSELEHFKKGKLTAHSSKSTGLSDMSFMDDFAEIEQLASEDKPVEPYGSKREAVESSGKELVPIDVPTGTTDQIRQPKIEKAVFKLIELIEGVIQRSLKDCSSTAVLSGSDEDNGQGTLSGYVARAFLWNTSELTSVLQNFLFVCNELLHGSTDVESFVHDLQHTLDWIVNHCFSLRDVSDMKETIMKHLELKNNDGLEIVAVTRHTGIHAEDEPRMPENFQTSLLADSNSINIGSNADFRTQKTGNEVADSKFQGITEKTSHLRAELNELKESGKIMAHADGESTMNDSSTYKAISKSGLNKGKQEVVGCLETEHQLECCPTKDGSKNVAENEEKHKQMQLEISTASEKLIECRETILNLGKQLKALASPKDAILFDQVLQTAARSDQKPRSQSLSEMLTMEDGGFYDPSSPKTKEIISTEPKVLSERDCSADEGDEGSLACSSLHPMPVVQPIKRACRANGTCKGEADVKVVTLAVVPRKQKGSSSLLKRILTGRRAMAKPQVVLSSELTTV